MMWRRAFSVCSLTLAACASAPDDRSTQVSAGDGLVRTDHLVQTRSHAPAMRGLDTRLYVREVALSGSGQRPLVLFVHGSGTPAEVSFDVPYRDYSWMGYLAHAGFDVFALDNTGYGRSTRPAPMQDACNFPSAQQRNFIPSVIPAPCAHTWKTAMTTMSSDWDDIEATVDELLRLRHADSIDIVAWSQGGPRAVGYALRHPARVHRLVLLAPAYTRDSASGPPASLPEVDGAMNAQSRTEFVANWDRQVGCADQYERAAADAIWADMLASDPVGAHWGAGVRRAPTVPTWGFNRETVERLDTPVLMVTGEHDKQVLPSRVHDLYADVGSTEKVLVDLACSSHNAMWERNHLALFEASLEWLTQGTVAGRSAGIMRLGE